MKGKTIRIYLADGDPNGIRTAEIINWTGNVLVAPRTQLSKFAKRDEAKRTGVYCLVGPDPENPLRDVVYVGEGDNVLKRLKKHDKEKDFWTRFFVVTSKDQNLTKSHVRYLESRMIATGRQTGRAKINNATTPPLPPLPPIAPRFPHCPLPPIARLLCPLHQLPIAIHKIGKFLICPSELFLKFQIDATTVQLILQIIEYQCGRLTGILQIGCIGTRF